MSTSGNDIAGGLDAGALIRSQRTTTVSHRRSSVISQMSNTGYVLSTTSYVDDDTIKPKLHGKIKHTPAVAYSSPYRQLHRYPV